MALSMPNILNILGVGDLLQSFQENEIGVDEVLLPSFGDFIKDLVKPVGRAIRVTNAWKLLMSQHNDGTLLAPRTTTTSGSIGVVASQSAASASSSSTASCSTVNSVTHSGLHPPQSSILTGTGNATRVGNFNGSPQFHTTVSVNAVVPASSAPVPAVSVLSSPASAVQNSAVVALVRSILDRSFTGRVLLRCSQKRLTNGQRNDLVRLVVEGVVNPEVCPRVPSTDFDRVADAISIIFPKETSLDYFIPGVVHPVLGRVRPKGKLITQYHTISSKCANGSSSGVQNNTENDDDPVAVELTVSLEFLQTHVEPWSEIQQHWSVTCSARLAELKKIRIPIAQYLNLYKCLQEALGYKLMFIDFCHLYPAASEPNWCEFFEKALVALTSLKKPCADLQETLQEINSDEILEESKYTLILLNLAQLCDVVNVAQKKVPKGQKAAKSIFRPTRAEIQEAFVVHVNTIGELNPLKERRKQRLAEFNLPMQPFVVVVGLDKQDLTGCYLIVEDCMYSMRSPKAAVDACFKSFHALWSHYPAEASNLWLLLQKKVYDIHTEFDLITSNLMALLRHFD